MVSFLGCWRRRERRPHCVATGQRRGDPPCRRDEVAPHHNHSAPSRSRRPPPLPALPLGRPLPQRRTAARPRRHLRSGWVRRRASPEHPTPPHLQGVATSVGAGQRTLGLRPPHEAGQRAAERLRVELGLASMTLQELRQGSVTVALEGGVGSGAAEPLGYLEVSLPAGEMQWRQPIIAGGVERGARAVQPLGDVEVTPEAGEVQWCTSIVVSRVDRAAHAVQQLSDVEVTLVAGVMQRCTSIVVGGVKRGTQAVQPLGDAEVACVAGHVQWLLTIIILRPRARAVRHRRLRCRQITTLHGVLQPSEPEPKPVAGERGGRQTDREVHGQAADDQIGRLADRHTLP
eukprot:scaffold29012_cov68-Phaeocystis_antarctica.AAC.1